jgi:hypothetical protein
MRTVIYMALLLLLIGCSNSKPELKSFEIIALELTPSEFDFNRNIKRYDSDSNWLFTIGRERRTIFKTSFDFTQIDSLFSPGGGPGEFVVTEDISLSKNRVWISDASKKTVEVFDKSLSYITTVVIEEPVISFAAKNDSVLYASQLFLDEWRIIEFSTNPYSGFNIVHSEEIRRDLSSGVVMLKKSFPYLIVMRLFTNNAMVIHMETGKKYRLRNPFLPEQPEFQTIMGTRIPTDTIWLDAFVWKDEFFMVSRDSENAMMVFRTSLYSDEWSATTIDENISGLLYFNDKLYGLSAKGYYTYEFN